MRTSFPPSERAGDASGTYPEADYLDLCARNYPEANRTAVLSLIPGLGQLKNGEIGKGLLFLVVGGTNVGLIASCFMRQQMTDTLNAIAVALHRQPHWELTSPLQGDPWHSPTLYIYAGLLVAFIAYAIRDAHERAVLRIRDKVKPPHFRLSLPEAASGSYLVHLAVMTAFLIIVVCFLSPQPPSVQVTTIELSKELPKPKSPDKPKPPAPKRELPKPVVKTQQKPVKVERKVVVPPKPVPKIEPPKPTPVAVAIPTKDPTPLTTAPVPVPAAAPEPAPATAAPSGGGGGRGAGTGTGDGGNGSGEIDMGPYMRELQRRIKHAWFPPKGAETKRIKVSFKVHKDGTISRLKLVTSAGNQMEDDAATQAVENAAPFAPLPEGAGDEVDINFTFDYTVFGGGGHSFR